MDQNLLDLLLKDPLEKKVDFSLEESCDDTQSDLPSPHEVCGWSGSLVVICLKFKLFHILQWESFLKLPFGEKDSCLCCVPLVCHAPQSAELFLKVSSYLWRLCQLLESSEYTTSNLPVKDWYGSSSHVFEQPLNTFLNTLTHIKHPTFNLPE